MKKMFVCGDSFMSPVVSHPNTHHSELLSQKIQYELVAYSRGGISNLGICLQVEAAIAEKADFILLNITSTDRIEIPLNLENDTYPYNIQDVVYIEHNSLSVNSGTMNKNSPKLISDTMHCLLDTQYHYATQYNPYFTDYKEFKNFIKSYFMIMHNHNWKKQVDYMCLYYALHKLYLSKIPYLMILSPNDIKNYCFWLDDTNFILEKSKNEFKIPDLDPGYHTSSEDQNYIYTCILDHLKKYRLLN